MKKHCFILFLFVHFSLVTISQTVFVSQSATGANNGTSWADAFTNLQSAIYAPTGSAQVWVAAGTYTPSGYSFRMRNDVAIYGGFAGNETELSQRDWSLNTTILMGKGDHSVVNNDFTFSNQLTETAVLDGFTIKNGHAGGNSSSSYPEGGGIRNYYASPTLENLVITENLSADLGGGIYGYNSGSKITNVTVTKNSAYEGAGIYFEYGRTVGGNYVYPSLTNVAVTSNTSQADGAGIYLFSSKPSITNAVISRNVCMSDEGGAMYVKVDLGSTNVFVANSLIANNEAGLGGGLYVESGSVRFENVTITQNRATNSGVAGIFLKAGNFIMNNSISYGNISFAPEFINKDFAEEDGYYSINHSVVREVGTYTFSPMFVDSVNGDFRLSPSSPLINRGDNVSYSNNSTVDLDGNPRIFADTIDIGAYEFQGYVSVKEFDMSALQIFPNPADDALLVDVKGPLGEFEIIVTDVTGNILAHYSSNHSQVEINTRSYSEGIYFLKVRQSGKQSSKKFVVVHD